jgi:bacterioferritin
MRNEDIVIEELNTLLRGIYMGIHALEHHIEKLHQEDVKKKFQSMQQEAKQNAQKLAERIQNLNGVPSDSEGVTGKMHSYMHKMMLSDDTSEIIEDALKGMEQYGVQYSEELVRGDLDPESQRLAEEVIDTSRKHAEELRQLLH